jgi:exosortase
MATTAELRGQAGVRMTRLSATTAVWVVTPLVLLALWPSGLSLIHFWIGIRDYQYGLVVAALCLAWLYVAARRLGTRPAQPEPWAWPGLLAATLGWTVAYLAASDMTHQVLLPVVLWLVIVASAGVAAGRVCAEPIACLYLAMPLWDYLLPFLQRATVVVTEGILHLLGIPAVVLASTVRIPEGSFEIVDGCAGKKYLMVAVTLAVLSGAYCRLSARARWLLTAVAAGLALIFNWLRVLVIVIAGHLTNMQHYLVAKDHIKFGSALFLVLVVILGLVLRRLASTTPAQAASPAPAQSAVAVRGSAGFAVLALLPLALPLASSLARTPAAEVTLGGLPLLAGVWQGPLPPNPAWRPRFMGAADEARAGYASPSGTVEVYMNVYGPQQPGRELVGYGNELLAPGAWQVESTAALPPLATEIAVSGVNRWVVGHLYATGGHWVRSTIGAQLGYGALDLTGTPASGIVAVAARCAADCAAAEGLIGGFWIQQGAQLMGLIPKSYARRGRLESAQP